MEYKFVEILDSSSNKFKVPIMPVAFSSTYWNSLYTALFYDEILDCYKYLGSAIADKNINTLIVLLRNYPTATHYAEITLRPEEKLIEIKKYYDERLNNQTLVCFSEI